MIAEIHHSYVPLRASTVQTSWDVYNNPEFHFLRCSTNEITVQQCSMISQCALQDWHFSWQFVLTQRTRMDHFSKHNTLELQDLGWAGIFRFLYSSGFILCLTCQTSTWCVRRSHHFCIGQSVWRYGCLSSHFCALPHTQASLSFFK